MDKKHSRKELLAALVKLQMLVGSAAGVAANDRNPNRAAQVAAILSFAEGVAIDALATEPPQPTPSLPNFKGFI